MNPAQPNDLAKLEQLVKNASNPRQKAMYQELLDKARQQDSNPTEEPTSKPNLDTSETETARTKKIKLTSPSKTPQVNKAKSGVTSAKASETIVTDEGEVAAAKTDTTAIEAENSEANIPVFELDMGEESDETPPFFQGIGIIKGKVNFSEDGQHTVTLGNQTYQLLYIPSRIRAWNALKKEVESTGNSDQRLLVYPKVIHYPNKDQPHRIAFQLLGFDKGEATEGAAKELKDFEFKLSGLWQFIPVCRTPCISILRNFTKERLEYMKQADPARKVKFMKASHVPLLWKDSPIKPFRFNPKAGKEQGHPSFVQVKAKFLPGRDVFGFIEQVAEPMERAPRFLKASKDDKAEALAQKRKTEKTSAKLPRPELS